MAESGSRLPQSKDFVGNLVQMRVYFWPSSSPQFHYRSAITAPPFSIRADRAGSALPLPTLKIWRTVHSDGSEIPRQIARLRDSANFFIVEDMCAAPWTATACCSSDQCSPAARSAALAQEKPDETSACPACSRLHGGKRQQATAVQGLRRKSRSNARLFLAEFLTAVPLPFRDNSSSVFNQGGPSRISPTSAHFKKSDAPLTLAGVKSRGKKLA